MIVNYETTEEQSLIQSSVSSLLSEKLPVDRLREVGHYFGAVEQSIWDDLVGIGLFGLGLSEQQGGIGYTLLEEIMTIFAMGENLVSVNLLAQMIAIHLAEDKDTLQRLMAGEAKASLLAVTDPQTAWLIDGDQATHVVILSDGLALQTIDQFTAASSAELIDETVSNKVIKHEFPPLPRSEHSDRLSLYCSAYLAGMAKATTEMAVAYANTREQFGHPISAFQALKHSCADMHVRAEAASSQTLYAATTFNLNDESTRITETACSRLLAQQAAFTNAKANIQIHGGMGFTAECDAHLYLKRAHVLSILGSSRLGERERILKGK